MKCYGLIRQSQKKGLILMEEWKKIQKTYRIREIIGINVEYDRETGKYYYRILDGLPIDFDEDELREFLYNNRKVINVTAKISNTSK